MSDLPNSWGVIGRIAARWTNWMRGQRAAAALRCCARDNLEHIARDLGMNSGELTALAEQGPRAAALLSRRLKAVGLDTAALADDEPAMMRYLERTCTCCGSKTACERDFERDRVSGNWREYCPNAPVLDALREEAEGRTRRMPDTAA